MKKRQAKKILKRGYGTWAFMESHDWGTIHQWNAGKYLNEPKMDKVGMFWQGKERYKHYYRITLAELSIHG
jgi:hypothetical protein